MTTGMLSWRPAPDGHLTVGKNLLAALGYPHVLIVERMGDTGLVLYQRDDPRASGKERKVRYHERAAPRLSIGPTPAQELGLRPGRYSAWIEEAAIYALPL